MCVTLTLVTGWSSLLLSLVDIVCTVVLGITPSAITQIHTAYTRERRSLAGRNKPAPSMDYKLRKPEFRLRLSDW